MSCESYLSSFRFYNLPFCLFVVLSQVHLGSSQFFCKLSESYVFFLFLSFDFLRASSVLIKLKEQHSKLKEKEKEPELVFPDMRFSCQATSVRLTEWEEVDNFDYDLTSHHVEKERVSHGR